MGWPSRSVTIRRGLERLAMFVEALQQSALDMTMLVKLMLEREARAAEKMQREMRAAEAQSRLQETLLRLARDRPAPPNPMEAMRDVMQLMQGMNNHQAAGAAAANGPDAVKILERGIAMGKELGGEGGGDEIPRGQRLLLEREKCRYVKACSPGLECRNGL